MPTTNAKAALKLVRPEYDDEGDYIPSPEFQRRPMEQPDELAARQADEAREYMAQVRSGRNLRFPWLDLDRVVGPLLPGWLVAVGGRGKAGKTTLLRELLTAWTELGKTVVYVGTETEASVLRLTWAAVRLGVPVRDALDPACPQALYERLMADVRTQTTGPLAYRAIFGEARDATLSNLTYWIEYARIGKAHALIFDHLHRLEFGQGERWAQLGGAMRALKNMAVAARLTLVVGAQLKQGEGGSFLGEHEVPGNNSWAGSSEIQREIDVGVQVWRPFRTSVTAKEKREARDDAAKVRGLLQANTMALRVAAHRYRGEAMNECMKLCVDRDQLSSWSSRLL